MTTPDGGGPADPILRISGLAKDFPLRRSLLDILKRREREQVHAVRDVDLEVRRGEVLGLAGESGSGKTVTAEMIARLQRPTRGSIEFMGRDVTDVHGSELQEFRRKVSMVFQDPYDSLNVRSRVKSIVSEPMRIQKLGDRESRERRVHEVLERVHLSPPEYYAASYPHELSGGERQRVAVARALVLDPVLLIADEPTTMLDVSVRAGLLNLLKEMTATTSLSMLFISHDFTTLSYLSDRIAIMYLGHVIERGPTHDVLTERLHPYTQALAAAIPRIDPTAARERVTTSIDTGAPPVGGCPFAPRCPEHMDVCDREMPPLMPVFEGHEVACHLYDGSGSVPVPAVSVSDIAIGADEGPRSRRQKGAGGAEGGTEVQTGASAERADGVQQAGGNRVGGAQLRTADNKGEGR